PPGSGCGSPAGAFVCDSTCQCPVVTTSTTETTSTSTSSSTSTTESTTSTTETTTSTTLACGNNVLDPGEQCDPPGAGCGSPAGAFVCDSACQCVTVTTSTESTTTSSSTSTTESTTSSTESTTSTTETTTSTTETTTTQLPISRFFCASDADCDDGDPCTLDMCQQGTCTSVPFTGFQNAICMTGQLKTVETCPTGPKLALNKKVKRVQRLIAKAQKSRKGARLLAQASAILDGVRAKSAKLAGHGHLNVDCASDLNDRIDDLQTIIGNLQNS